MTEQQAYEEELAHHNSMCNRARARSIAVGVSVGSTPPLNADGSMASVENANPAHDAKGRFAHLAGLAKDFPDASMAKLQKIYDRQQAPAVSLTATPSVHSDKLVATIGKLGEKSYNFVHLGDVRDAHPELSHDQFDAALHQARVDGRVTMSALEGGRGVSQRDLDSAIEEQTAWGPNKLLYASLKR